MTSKLNTNNGRNGAIVTTTTATNTAGTGVMHDNSIISTKSQHQQQQQGQQNQTQNQNTQIQRQPQQRTSIGTRMALSYASAAANAEEKQYYLQRYNKIQSFYNTIVPQSMTLTAIVQFLLHNPLIISTNNTSTNTTTTNTNTNTNNIVYLMDRSYIKNWLVWAWYQPVPTNEIQRLYESIRMITIELGFSLSILPQKRIKLNTNTNTKQPVVSSSTITAASDIGTNTKNKNSSTTASTTGTSTKITTTKKNGSKANNQNRIPETTTNDNKDSSISADNNSNSTTDYAVDVTGHDENDVINKEEREQGNDNDCKTDDDDDSDDDDDEYTTVPYTSPGPINNRILAIDEYPLVLDTNVHVINYSSNWYKTIIKKRIINSSNYNNMKMNVINENDTTVDYANNSHDDDDNDYDDDDDDENNNKNNKSRISSISTQAVPMKKIKKCVAVPEAFYETLRQCHGVICDDMYSISFQPPIQQQQQQQQNQQHQHHNCESHDTSTDENYTSDNINNSRSDESIILQHFVYNKQTTSTTTSSSPLATPPRPIEFRRKVIRVLDYEAIRQQEMKKTSNLTSLMEKLLLEEKEHSIQQNNTSTGTSDNIDSTNTVPTMLTVETYPIQLSYSTVTTNPNNNTTASSTSTDSTKLDTNNVSNERQRQPLVDTMKPVGSESVLKNSQNEQQVATVATTTSTITYPMDGFVLVSRTVPAIDAVTAVMRIVEPNKALQSVRIWSQWMYGYGSNCGTLSSLNQCNSRPTKCGDGYELIDFRHLSKGGSTKKNNNKQQQQEQQQLKGIDSPGTVPNGGHTSTGRNEIERVSIGDWAKTHFPGTMTSSLLSSSLSSSTRNTSIRRLVNIRNGTCYSKLNDLSILIETQKTIHTEWPREYMHQSCHRLRPGDFIDAQDATGKWYESRVRSINIPRNIATVHYVGWSSKWDTEIQLQIPRQHQQLKTTNGASSKLHGPAPLWSQSGRWREQLRIGDTVEIRDSSSLVERPKWYCGIVKKFSSPNSPIRDMFGGAELELYKYTTIPTNPNDPQNHQQKEQQLVNSDMDNYNSIDPLGKEASSAFVTKNSGQYAASIPGKTKGTTIAPLLILHRTQQVLVEVEQERVDRVVGTTTNTKNGTELRPSARLRSMSSSLPNILDNDDDTENNEDMTPHPPALRWVNLYGEEICKYGTHLKPVSATTIAPPVTLTYELDSNRQPVEIMKQTHPMHGSGFMRESLRGNPPAPGLVGLHNLGNSCFLNSTVQCLNHIQLLTQYFLDDRYIKDLNKNNPLGSGGNVSVAFASLLKKIWAGQHSILVPRMLKQTVANFAPQFDNSYQHDSHEFCQFLMDGLHEDLNRVKKKPYFEELEARGMDDNRAAIESWRKHLLRHDSIIVDHCQGMHRSHLTCPQCGRESIKFDVYSSISLPLATEKKKTTTRLQDCIEKFMEAEQLDERDAYYCSSCRRHVCALKLIALWTVPDILIFHLKRFQFDTCMTSGGMLRSKLDEKVVFPIDGLDLTDEVLGPIDPDAPPIYNLFGVSEHIGYTANSGHYTATVRNSVDGKWYRCNDSHIGQTSGEAAVTGGAYLLFYHRAKGLSKWGGLGKVMKEHNINPYGGLDEPITDKEGFTQVNKKKKGPYK